MSAQTAVAGSVLGGRTTIRPRALRRLAEAVISELAGVDSGDVHAELSDVRGRLAVDVATPLNPAGTQSGTLLERAAEASAVLAHRLDALAARDVGRVHVRFTRLARAEERRVR